MKEENQDGIFDDAEIISQYTSKQAENDGYLIRVDLLGEPRINFFTRNVWQLCIEPYAQQKRSEVPDLVKNLKRAVIHEIIKAGKQVQLLPDLKLLDWFYSVKVNDWEFFLCQNETGSYTLLFPEDY